MHKFKEFFISVIQLLQSKFTKYWDASLCHRTTGSSAATECTEAIDQEGQVRGSGTQQYREESQRWHYPGLVCQINIVHCLVIVTATCPPWIVPTCWLYLSYCSDRLHLSPYVDCHVALSFHLECRLILNIYIYISYIYRIYRSEYILSHKYILCHSLTIWCQKCNIDGASSLH